MSQFDKRTTAGLDRGPNGHASAPKAIRAGLFKAQRSQLVFLSYVRRSVRRSPLCVCVCMCLCVLSGVVKSNLTTTSFGAKSCTNNNP